MKIEQSHNLFIEHLKNQGKSHSTILAYGKDIKQFIESLANLNVAEVKEIEPNHITAFLSSLENTGYTPKSVSRKLNSIKTFCKILIQEGILEENPSSPISHPKIQPKQQRVLTELEFRSLRDIVRNDVRLYTIVEVLLNTGLRIGELARVMVEHVDVDQNHIHVVAFGSNPERQVPLNKTAVLAIEKYLRHREHKDAEHLFITKTGRQLLVRNIRTSISKAFEKAGIENAKVNDLRNTFIAHNLSKGANLQAISKIVGHKRVSTTEKYLELIDKKGAKDTKLVEL